MKFWYKSPFGLLEGEFTGQYLVDLHFATQEQDDPPFVSPLNEGGLIVVTKPPLSKGGAELDPPASPVEPKTKRGGRGEAEGSLSYQLNSYFSGKLKVFTIPIKLNGTKFQKDVWCVLMTTPYGETRSYAEIAKMTKKPRAVRAVATAVAKNKIAVIVPCHRVIRSNGEMGKYAWGKETKERLIKIEGNNK